MKQILFLFIFLSISCISLYEKKQLPQSAFLKRNFVLKDNEKTGKKDQTDLLKNIFSNNLELDEMRMICSLNTQIDLHLTDLPQEKWNLWTIEAIGCVKPQSEKVQMALITPNRSIHELESAIIALGKIKPQSEKIQLKLVSLLSTPEARVQISVANTLSKIGLQNEKVQMALVNMLIDRHKDIRQLAHYTLFKIKPQSEKILKKIKAYNLQLYDHLISYQ